MEEVNIELSKEQELEIIKYAKMLDITIEEFIAKAIELFIKNNHDVDELMDKYG